MIIRPLGHDDADTLWAARLQALRESPAAFLSTLAEAAGDTARVMQAQLDDPHTRYFGAFDQATLVGFLRYVRPVRLARRHTAEIHSVHVGAGHRGHGIARQLFLAAFAAACTDGIESLTLAVLADNAAARGLQVPGIHRIRRRAARGEARRSLCGHGVVLDSSDQPPTITGTLNHRFYAGSCTGVCARKLRPTGSPTPR